MQRPNLYIGFAAAGVIVILFFFAYHPSYSFGTVELPALSYAARPSPVGEGSGINAEFELNSANKTIITPTSLGIILDSKNTAISSPNGRYSLNLLPNGNVILQEGQKILWWTNTGDNVTKSNHALTLSRAGQLAVTYRPKGENVRQIWHSNLLLQCSEKQSDPSLNAQLTLSDAGELAIYPHCQIYSPPPRSSGGRLALVVSGLYRTNKETCHSHMSHLVSNPAFSSVDVFVYALFEKGDIKGDVTPSTIEANIRACYGDYLRAVTVEPVEQVEEKFPAFEVGPCGARLHRLHSQLKTLYRSGLLWWKWSVDQGATHDTVLRIRLDSKFHGDMLPEFKSVDQVGKGRVVIPHTWPSGYFYCALPNGNLNVGPSDQMAYGSPSAMHIWFSFYNYFPTIVQESSDGDSVAFRSFSGCETLPASPLVAECKNAAPCSIECIVAYYLGTMGVDYEVEFGWKVDLLR